MISQVLRMMSVILTLTLLGALRGQKITHELPRSPHHTYSRHLHDVGLSPHPGNRIITRPDMEYLPQKPYVSPLRPGYQWPGKGENSFTDYGPKNNCFFEQEMAENEKFGQLCSTWNLK